MRAIRRRRGEEEEEEGEGDGIRHLVSSLLSFGETEGVLGSRN